LGAVTGYRRALQCRKLKAGIAPKNEVEMNKDDMAGEPRLTTLAHGGG